MSPFEHTRASPGEVLVLLWLKLLRDPMLGSVSLFQACAGAFQELTLNHLYFYGCC